LAEVAPKIRPGLVLDSWWAEHGRSWRWRARTHRSPPAHDGRAGADRAGLAGGIV